MTASMVTAIYTSIFVLFSFFPQGINNQSCAHVLIYVSEMKGKKSY